MNQKSKIALGIIAALIAIWMLIPNNANKNTASVKIPEYDIIDSDGNKAIGLNVTVRIQERFSASEMESISNHIRSTRKQYTTLRIFYLLPKMEVGHGAWATAHFTPNLELKIVGSTSEEKIKLEEVKVTGLIKNTWKIYDAFGDGKVYLVEENGKLFIKTIYAPSSMYGDNPTEIKSEVHESNMRGLKRLSYGNDGEYYLIDKNGNLGLYDSDGKIYEAIKD